MEGTHPLLSSHWLLWPPRPRPRQLTCALPQVVTFGMPSPHLWHCPSMSSLMHSYGQILLGLAYSKLWDQGLCLPQAALPCPLRFTARTARAPQIGRASSRFSTLYSPQSPGPYPAAPAASHGWLHHTPTLGHPPRGVTSVHPQAHSHIGTGSPTHTYALRCHPSFHRCARMRAHA